MQLDSLIASLSNPAAYPDRASGVEVHQTHISAVFVTGDHAYKIKKPVDFGFLDFSTLPLRKHFCQEEVRLNRRLADEVYLDVVPIVQAGDGVRVEAEGEPIEWAVKMRRLAEDAMLEHRLARSESIDEALDRLARRLAAFHARAERGEAIRRFGRFDVVEQNALENFEQAAGQVGAAVSHSVFARLKTLTSQALGQLESTIADRAARDVPCDTHGDLRLGHVYWFPQRRPPSDLVIVDCIEFSERFRYADPVSDMAFLAMGLARFGRAELAERFAEAYFQASGDDQGRRLLPFYVSYRAAVRGKVDGMQALRPEIAPADRTLALAKARGHWLLALAALESPGGKPCLLLVGGLPGVGKSTLAADLAKAADCEVIRSDVVRKELAGAAAEEKRSAPFSQGIYSPEWNERTYAECQRRAEALLFEGGRVIVDASFRDESERRRLLESAAHHGVPAVFLHCQADEQTVRSRLAMRTGDASDADWSIHEQAARTWQAPDESTQRVTTIIDTGASREVALAAALTALHAHRLSE